MAPRSPRQKIMFQIGKAAACVDRVVDHLAAAEMEADGKHERLSAMLPLFVQECQLLKEALQKFRLQI